MRRLSLGSCDPGDGPGPLRRYGNAAQIQTVPRTVAFPMWGQCRCSDEQAERDMSAPILRLHQEQSADHWRTHEFSVPVVRQIAHGEGPPDAVLCGFFPREQEEVVGGSGRVVQGWGEPSRLARPLIRGWRPPAAECKSSLLLDPGAVVSAII